jgi:DNA-binding NtrC family response regulator
LRAGTHVALARRALTSNPQKQPTRVLLVEDDEALGEMFADVLRDRGHAVTLASDVGSAITALSEGTFDVLVTDLRLPGASGLELLAWVKRERLALRVVVASAFATVELSLHARRLGAREVLSKPVEPEALVAAVEAA